ncbi:TonB-dependent receptor [Pseudomaricurvus alkylphenolicus]|uniref:TonB-dependent receptor n=1 Tax=Pseudomaricurvus alkylphenolicus TaxID=1306991 RepID=UPI001424150D|nr:TonB-dependent receptor [Pseudomaricurvus alkylphenolicus]NIB40592.1 TonB-dependent receptor [Pseudomaricurvus alkylphenolicus]
MNDKFKIHRLSGAGLLALGISLAPQYGLADTALELEEVVVTATKREQSLQDISLSVTAIGEVELERSGAAEFADYATSVPNLSFGYSGEGRQTSRKFQLRGITGDDTSALYIDETAVPTTMDPRVIDVERVEVLRGPQGTLFGARSMGGLVRMVTKKPSTDEVEGKLHAAVGSMEGGGLDYRVDGSVNLPLAENVALRLTGYYLRDAGFIDRIVDPDGSAVVGGEDALNGDEYRNEDINEDSTQGFQASLFWQVSEELMLQPQLMYQKTESDGPAFVDEDIDNFTKIRQFDVTEEGEDEWSLAALTINYDLGYGEIVSSTSYFERETLDIEDGTIFMSSFLGGPAVASVDAPAITFETSDEERITQELRFVSNFEGKLNMVAGVFYQKIDREGGFPPASIVPGGAPFIGFAGFEAGDSFFSLQSHFEQEELGLFGEFEYSLTDTLTMTVGGRWFDVSTEDERIDGGTLFTKLGVAFGFPIPEPFKGGVDEDGFNPRVALSWDINDEVTLYSNVAKGYRPGDVNDAKAACEAVGLTDIPEFTDSDSLWNYELGAKTRLWGGRATLNMATYFISWDERRAQTINCGLGFSARDNVGEVESKGAELELMLQVTEGFSLSAGVGYTDSRITDTGGALGVEEGQALANVPRWNGALALDYDFSISEEMDGYSRFDYRYVGSSVSAQGNDRDRYELINLRAGIQWGSWDLSAFVENLTDERANLADPAELSDSLNLIAVGRPRTLGMSIRKTF